MTRVVCILPARGGSVRIPNKNRRLFHGKPMLQRATDLAHASRLFDEVIVSTDDDEIAWLAVDECRATVVRRDRDDGTKGTQEIARDVLVNHPCSIACVLYPCTPLLTARELITGYQRLLAEPCDYTYSVDGLGHDAGGYYWGWVHSFLSEPVLEKSYRLGCVVANHFDINTPEDWSRAEEAYARIHG